jgi:hypothetical protein
MLGSFEKERAREGSEAGCLWGAIRSDFEIQLVASFEVEDDEDR